MKKILVFLLAALFACSFSGCKKYDNGGAAASTKDGDDPNDSQTEPPYTDSDDHTSSDALPTFEEIQAEYPDKTVLVWAADSYCLDETIRLSEANKYLTEIGCDFVLCLKPVQTTSGLSGNYPDLLASGIKAALDSGEQVDIATPRIYSEFVSADMFEPLDEYLNNTDIGRELYSLMPEKYWEILRANGKIYGVCGSLNNVLSSDHGFFVNPELAEKYGFDVNKPILDQLDILRKVKQEENCPVLASDMTYYPSDLVGLKMFGNGVYWNEESHTARCILDCAEYVEKLRFLDTLNREGMLMSRFSGGELRTDFFISETSQQGAALGYDKGQTVEYNYYDQIVLGIPVFDGTSTYRSTPYTVTGVLSASQNKDKAFRLLALTQIDPYLCDLLTFGIEGEDYNLTDGKVDNVTSLFAPEIFGNKLISHSSEGVYSAGEMYYSADKYREILENAQMPADSDFCFDYSEMIDEMNAVDKVFQSFRLPSSDVSLDDALTELNGKLESAGVQKIIDEVNRQYEVYLNEKE